MLNEALFGALPAAPAAGQPEPAEAANTRRLKLYLLSALPVDIRAILTRLCSPTLPRDKTFLQLKTILRNHYFPRTTATSNVYKFQRLTQAPTEVVGDFVLRLRTEAHLCDFGEDLDRRLREQLSLGVKEETIRDKIFDAGRPTFEEAVNIAQNEESRLNEKRQATQDREALVNRVYYQGNQQGRNQKKQFTTPTGGRQGHNYQARGPSQGSALNFQARSSFHPGAGGGGPPTSQIQLRCWRCGRPGCDPNSCWAKTATCDVCHKVGHIKYYHTIQVNSLTAEGQPVAVVAEQGPATHHAEPSPLPEEAAALGGAAYSGVTYIHHVQEVDVQEEKPDVPFTTIPENWELEAEQFTAEFDSQIHQGEECDSGSDGKCDSGNDGKCDSGSDGKCDDQGEDGRNDVMPVDQRNEMADNHLLLDVILEDISQKCQSKVMGSPSDECKHTKAKVMGNPLSECKPTEAHSSEEFSSDCFGELHSINLNKLEEIARVNHIEVNLLKSAKPALTVSAQLESQKVVMEVDTGSKISLMSDVQFKELFPRQEISGSVVELRTLSAPLDVVGSVFLKVKLGESKEHKLTLVICHTSYPFMPLLGRDWLDMLCPRWRESVLKGNVPEINAIKLAPEAITSDDALPPEIQELVSKYPSVFSKDKSQSIAGVKANIVFKENPVFMVHREYDLPYSVRSLVTDKIREEVQEGRWIPVDKPKAGVASPLWQVPKANNDLRLVVDYKRVVNQNVVVDYCRHPKPEFMYNELNGCDTFCVIDLSEAFMQMELEENCQKYLTISTHIGFFKPTRLMYGVASAPGIFQSFMENVVRDMPGVQAFQDDVIVGGKGVEDTLQKLEVLFKRFSELNLRVNLGKCKFLRSEVEYLGLIIGKDGLRVSDKRVLPILDARRPENKSEVRSFLGAVNFYCRFLPNLSDLLKPLTDLTQDCVPFAWDGKCEAAFVESKQLLAKNRMLTLYDPDKPLVLVCDASPNGVGCLLAHRVDGIEYPISYASSKLTPSQSIYSQIEREALGIVFGLSHFNQYLAGREFILVTDNLPLRWIHSPDRDLPTMASARIQRWAAQLGAHKYSVEYRKSQAMGPADMLSRLCNHVSIVETVNFVNVNFDALPLSHVLVAEETKKCPILSKVVNCVRSGWPARMPDTDPMSPYFKLRLSLSVEAGCVLFGDKVIIPTPLRKQVLELLHAGHPGITRMIMQARNFVYWPKIQDDISNAVKGCEPCSRVNFKPVSRELTSWEPTQYPWTRLHLDFFFFKTVTFLILVDSHTKWIEVWPVPSTAASHTIEKLRLAISVFGFPLHIVTDNGPPVDSVAFIDFAVANNIILSKSPPYHPQSNGLAERGVCTFKQALKKAVMSETSAPLQHKLVNLLFEYRNTPSTVTGLAPAQLMLSYVPRTPLALLAPPATRPGSYTPNVPVFAPGETVRVRRRNTDEVTDGTVLKQLGVGVYVVNVANRPILCHINQLNHSAKLFLESSCADLSTVPVSPPVIPDPDPPQRNPPLEVPLPPTPGVDDPVQISPEPAVRRTTRSTQGVPHSRLDL